MLYFYTGIGIVLGGLLGFFYWKWVGCQTGVCLITRNKFISTIYGALVGGLAALQFNLV